MIVQLLSKKLQQRYVICLNYTVTLRVIWVQKNPHDISFILEFSNNLNIIILIKINTVLQYWCWGEPIKSEISGLFDNVTSIINKRPLLADKIIPTALTWKTKANIYVGLDIYKARKYLRGNMQVKDDFMS